MHYHQCVACSPVAELLKKLLENIAIVLHERLVLRGEQVLEQPRPLKETDKFVNINGQVSFYGISGWYNMLE